ncbi:class I SAM-dependent methyltransferase [Runella slithyformis]|uniref:Methyltransferase type 11 n=1 Tax=Runella slithyformis (strain ATCC 29530 / DSM 19594 / LMG 11500 / NCIMB 11436 / LSU 4) TaxID=761193 RepID=A0A7U3ZK63_RUNSL|nr:class I SAM-dependent methyltransferase [Runella slithyformis]AEI48721.1 Methyltransferase type 11 [Runella slithyformis DSM 19594]
MEAGSYDQIAREYRDSKKLDFRKCIEEYTLLQLAGDISGLHLLDLACGEGIYTRKLKKQGAATILGVDLSARMIDLAEEAESREPLGCRYLVHDVLQLQPLGEYDIVVGMYLLNYARSPQELTQFCKVVCDHLKPGGRFIGFNDNPLNDAAYYANYRKYGFVKETTEQRNEGDFVKYRMFNLDGTEFSFDNFYFSPQTYADAFAKAGLKNFRWEGPLLHPEQHHPKKYAYWEDFMKHPPLMGFSAVKA